MLSQYDIQHPKGFLGVLRFLTTQSITNCLHRYLSSIAYLYFETLGLVWPSQSLPIILICIPTRTSVSIVSESQFDKTNNHKPCDIQI